LPLGPDVGGNSSDYRPTEDSCESSVYDSPAATPAEKVVARTRWPAEDTIKLEQTFNGFIKKNEPYPRPQEILDFCSKYEIYSELSPKTKLIKMRVKLNNTRKLKREMKARRKIAMF